MRKRVAAICVLTAVIMSACGSAGKTSETETAKPAQEERAESEAEEAPEEKEESEAEEAPEEKEESVSEENVREEATKTMRYGGVSFEIPASWKTEKEDNGLKLQPNERSLVQITSVIMETGSNAEENLQVLIDQNSDSVIEVNGKEGVFIDQQGKTDAGEVYNQRLYVFSPNETWAMYIYCASVDPITFDGFIETLDFSGAVAAAPRKPELSMKLFNKIEEGMSYEELKEIFGEDGKKTSESTILDSTLTSYQWGSYTKGITVEMVDDEVTGKSQIGLGSSTTPTLEGYSRCEVGMSYEEVAAILGDGELDSVAWVLGSKTEMYSWGSGLKLVSMMFEDGKLFTKYQIGLE